MDNSFIFYFSHILSGGPRRHHIPEYRRRTLRQRIADELAYFRARTPKLDKRFGHLVRAGKVKIVRRRFRPPMVKIIGAKRRRW